MKKWEKPKLIILARGQPEERILVACKTMYDTGGSPQYVDYQCDSPVEDCEIECNTIASS
jgi:hypothetical protein